MIRHTVSHEDIEPVRRLVEQTGVFSAEEIDVAAELVAEAAAKGEKESGYSFVFAEEDGALLGYACFGRIPLTESSYDLYWLAVDNGRRKKGIAAHITALCEDRIKKEGGTQVYAETSSREDYTPARSFYLKAGYEECARQKDFYRKGDDKVTYVKFLL